MNKFELARELAKKFGFIQKESNVIVDKILSTMEKKLVEGKNIELRGLGTFATKARKSSIGRVVKTGERVVIPPMQRVYFKPGQKLKKQAIKVMQEKEQSEEPKD